MDSKLKRKRELEFDNELDSADEYEVATGKGTKGRCINKQRVLVFSSRGITSRYRHLLTDLRTLLPHHKKEVKHDAKDDLTSVNEVAEMKGCETTIFFECRKKKDLYIWFACTPSGPSAKFLVQNVHTMDELKLTGNCLMGSRPLLLFDSKFDEIPHLQLLKQIFIKTWNTPRNHPKSKPFVDHIFTFFFADNRIFFRNYQIADASKDIKELKKMAKAGEETTSLIEVGPRFVLNPIRIFSGSFSGSTLYENKKYVSPNTTRSDVKKEKANRYAGRLEQRQKHIEHNDSKIIPENPLKNVFVVEKEEEEEGEGEEEEEGDGDDDE